MNLAVSSMFSRMIPSILAKTYDHLLAEVFVVFPEVKVSQGSAKARGPGMVYRCLPAGVCNDAASAAAEIRRR